MEAVRLTVIGKPLSRDAAVTSARISASRTSSNGSCTSLNSSMNAPIAGTIREVSEKHIVLEK